MNHNFLFLIFFYFDINETLTILAGILRHYCKPQINKIHSKWKARMHKPVLHFIILD